MGQEENRLTRAMAMSAAGSAAARVWAAELIT
jgi:hypothetical protein